MDTVLITRCRSCGAKIRWTRTAAGKLMPLDYEPSPRGTVVLTSSSRREVKYISHLATCPQANLHRRKNGA